MPKGRKKGRKGDGGGPSGTNGLGGSASHSDALEDAMSVASQHSATSDEPMASVATAGQAADDVEGTNEHDLEDKIAMCIEGMSDKSAKTRVNSLASLHSLFIKSYIGELLEDRKVTLADCAERSIKKGKDDERAMAGATLMLLLIQLGEGSDADETFNQVQPTLFTALADPKLSAKVRGVCASTLGMGAFITSSDEVVGELMSRLQSIFSLSYLKGDRTPPQHTPVICQMHTSALRAWCLLLTVRPLSAIHDLILTQIRKLPEILQSPDLGLRIAAGEAIALLYELIRTRNEDFRGHNEEELLQSLKALATDCAKFRNKKDRRSQRSSFRDILDTVEGGSPLTEDIKFGRGELLHLDQWKTKLQYESFSDVLGSGMNTHLQTNPLLRDVFDLGDMVDLNTSISRESKSDMKLYLQAASKARTLSRQKTRDKRIPRL